MFKSRRIKYFKIRNGCLNIKYRGGLRERRLTCGKADLEDFREKQKEYLRVAREKVNRDAATWKQRRKTGYKRYLENRELAKKYDQKED